MDITAILIPLTVLLLYLILSPSDKTGSDRLWNYRNARRAIPLLFFLFLLSAFRSTGVGADTEDYFELYETIASADRSELLVLLTRFEAGFVFIVKVLTYVSRSPSLFFILSSVVIYSALYLFLKKFSPYALLSVLLFFFLRYHDEFMNVARQAVAISILLLSYKKLKERKVFYYLILVVFATLIHKSSIVFLLAWPVSRIQFRKNYLVFLYIGWAFLFMAGAAVTSYLISSGVVYSYYEGSEYLSGGKSAPFLFLLLDIIVFALCLNYKVYHATKYRDMVLYGSDMMWFLVIGIYLDTLNLSFAILTRVAWIFTFFKILIIPYIIVQTRPVSKRRLLMALQLFLIVYYYVIVVLRPEWNPVYPYTTFL